MSYSLHVFLTSSLADDPSGHVVGDDAGNLPEALTVVLGDLQQDELLGGVHGGGGGADDGDEAEVGAWVEGLVSVGDPDGGVGLPLQAADGGAAAAEDAAHELVGDEKDELVVVDLVLVHGVGVGRVHGGAEGVALAAAGGEGLVHGGDGEVGTRGGGGEEVNWGGERSGVA